MTDLAIPIIHHTPFATVDPSRLLDESLFLQCAERWEESRQQLRGLTAGIPGIRDTLNAWLKDKLGTDNDVRLHFFAAADAPARYVNLAEASAFVLQHPLLPASLDQRCQVLGLKEPLKQYATKPAALLEHLKTLGLEAFLKARWTRYWNERAPASPLSRRELALSAYRQHFECAFQMALAQRTVNADLVKPLMAIVESARGELQLDGQKIYTEQLSLIQPGQDTLRLPGAWVITLDSPPPVTQLLYLPLGQTALKVFNQRDALERWLIDTPAVFPGVPQPALASRILYGPKSDVLTTGITQLLEGLHAAQLASLYRSGGADLATQGANALVAADLFDRQRDQLDVFAPPPSLPTPDPDDIETAATEAAQPASLSPEIPLAQRRADISYYRAALLNHLGDDFEGEFDQPALQALMAQFSALETAEKNAHAAATALLGDTPERLLEPLLPIQPYEDLYQARLDGLRCEGEIQRSLKQITETQYNWLKAVLDHPHQIDRDREHPTQTIAVASLTLSISEPDTTQTITHTQELSGALLITTVAALENPATTESLLLYWPGSGGGLWHYASKQALEQSLFKIYAGDDAPVLQLTPIKTQPFRYALKAQINQGKQQINALLQRYPADTHGPRRASELEKAALQLIEHLLVPIDTARALAYQQVLERDQSSTLAKHSPQWLGPLSDSQRAQLKALIGAYLQAAKRAQQHLDRCLPLRDEFCEKVLNARLRKDFSLEGNCEVKFDLPESIKEEAHFYPAPGAPGTPVKLVLVPSKGRKSWTLAELALHSIDEPSFPALSEMKSRLQFRKVSLTCAYPSDTEKLTTGLTLEYLVDLVKELDLAQVYEDLIYNTFMGLGNEPLFMRQYRRECLVDLWRQTLKLQGECAVLQQHISADDLLALNIAIDASAGPAWQVGTKHLELLPVHLSVGGKDTESEGPSALVGIILLHEKNTGRTLLYTHEAIDEQFLRGYASLEEARLALFNMSLRPEVARYLARCTAHGKVESHVSRINQAHLKKFDALIGIGVRWPHTTSLAALQANSAMGRLIAAHRDTSRSKSALHLEQYALKAGVALNYAKMAIGIFPIVGTGVALYDAWNSANLATAAFLRGEAGAGIEELAKVFQSLIDAWIDLAPGTVVVPTTRAGWVRALTNRRQISGLLRSTGPLASKSGATIRRTVERFAGYEYTGAISLAGIEPGHQGLYRNVFRHPDGDFIIKQGRIYQVEPSTDSRNLRLSGTPARSYKQPIALDEAGNWDTYYGVYGCTFEGGGLGGGGVIGHLGERLDPIWPHAIRARLPEWLTDRIYSQQRALQFRVSRRFNTNVQNHERIQDLFKRLEADDLSVLGDLETRLDQGVVLNKQLADSIDEAARYAHGRRGAVGQRAKSEVNRDLVWYSQIQVKLKLQKMLINFDQIQHLLEQLQQIPYEQLSTRVSLTQQIRARRMANFELINQIEASIERLNAATPRVTIAADHKALAHASEVINRRMSPRLQAETKTELLLELVAYRTDIDDVSWHYLQGPLKNTKAAISRALNLQTNLVEVNPSRTVRNQILNACIRSYEQAQVQLRHWVATYPQHFDADYLQALLEELDKVSQNARKGLDEGVSQHAQRRTEDAARSRPRLFETTDQEWMIGVEHWDARANVRRYTITRESGQTETWVQGADGRSRLENPTPIAQIPAAGNASALVAEARNRLNQVPGYVNWVNQYLNRMTPRELQELLAREANELLLRARTIEPHAPSHQVIARLREQATQLNTRGRQVRTAQSLASEKPTDDMLDDLLSENVVDIRRKEALLNKGKRKDGRTDYLQEFEVWDISATPASLLWYAHFHYSKAAPVFLEFEKAHLKLPKHRWLTSADGAHVHYGHIEKRSPTLTHFPAL